MARLMADMGWQVVGKVVRVVMVGVGADFGSGV